MKRAFYDFSVSPYSFDFAVFLMVARSRKVDEIVIVPGTRYRRLPDGQVVEFQKCTPGEQEYRLNNLILGLCPGAVVCGSRDEAKTLWTPDCFPDNYTVDAPVAAHTIGHLMKEMEIHPFMPSKEKMEELAKDGWAKEDMAVITIRHTRIKSLRNSHVEEWVKAAQWMKTIGLNPVFVPDTEEPAEDFGGFPSCSKAATDVQYRLALYQAAAVNLGVNNGPMALNLFSRRSMLYFRPITRGYTESQEQFWKASGIPVNSQLPWFTILQRIIWEGVDDFENIKLNVERWMEARKGKDVWPLAVAPSYPIYGVVKGDERGKQMAECLKYKFPQMVRKPYGTDVLSVACYGPSLKDTWRELKRPIMSVSGAHDFLIERGIIPDYHVDCDPRAHKVEMLTPHKGVKYRMATVCHPSLWPKLEGHDVEVWHLHNGPETDEWIKANDPGANVVGGGSTAGMRALEVGSMLGYRRFEVHGIDASYESDAVRHAGKHLGKKQNLIDVSVDGTWFKSSPQMIEAAKEMITFIQNFDVEIVFYGVGLQQAMVKHYLKRFRVIEPKPATIKEVA